MNTFNVEISDRETDKSVINFIISSDKTLNQAKDFFQKNWPMFFDMIVMLMVDEEPSIKAKTSRGLDILSMIFEWTKSKRKWTTRFTVTNHTKDTTVDDIWKCDCDTCKEENKDDTWLPKELTDLLDKLWGNAIKIDWNKDFKEILELVNKLIK